MTPIPIANIGKSLDWFEGTSRANLGLKPQMEEVPVKNLFTVLSILGGRDLDSWMNTSY